MELGPPFKNAKCSKCNKDILPTDFCYVKDGLLVCWRCETKQTDKFKGRKRKYRWWE